MAELVKKFREPQRNTPRITELFEVSFKMFVFSFILFVFALTSQVLAQSYKIANGKEFNNRIKMYLSDNDKNWDKDYSITGFMRGNSPPNDITKIIDISEDSDGTVVAYISNNIIYVYSDYTILLNEDCSYMFEKFLHLSNVNFDDILFLGLKDTRYMFANCHRLKKLTWSKKHVVDLSYMTGMFYDCQSLVNVDISKIDTHLISNMDSVFENCYNIKNIYVDKANWNIESLSSVKKMFKNCHMLKTNFGKKAVDMAIDDYEEFLIPGDTETEGLLKDINTKYDDYGERDGSAPIDRDYYVVETAAPIIEYAPEPEGDGDGNGDGNGTGGDGGSDNISIGLGQGDIAIAESVVSDKNETSITKESTEVITESVITETLAPIIEESTIINDKEVVIENVQESITESIQSSDSANELSGKKVMELDEYLREHGNGEGIDNGTGEKGSANINYRFLIFALVISVIAILLLTGVVAFLVKDKKENNSDNSI